MKDYEEINHCDITEQTPFNDFNEAVDKLKNCSEDSEEFCADMTSKMYGEIFDTGYYWDVPYLIDVEKYKQVTDAHRMPDEYTKHLSFTMEMSKMWGGVSLSFVAFSNVENKDKNEWHYDYFAIEEDNIQEDESRPTRKDFIEQVKKITSCIIGVDKEARDRDINERITEINKLRTLNSTLLELTEE